MVPYKQLSLLEEKALIEIDRVRQRKEAQLEKVCNSGVRCSGGSRRTGNGCRS
jgi:hypothetical protein